MARSVVWTGCLIIPSKVTTCSRAFTGWFLRHVVRVIEQAEFDNGKYHYSLPDGSQHIASQEQVFNQVQDGLAELLVFESPTSQMSLAILRNSDLLPPGRSGEPPRCRYRLPDGSRHTVPSMMAYSLIEKQLARLLARSANVAPNVVPLLAA